MRQRFYLISISSVLVCSFIGFIWPFAIWLLLPVSLFIVLGIYDISQPRHTILRNFPVVGHARWIAEWLRPMLRQYYMESDTDGVPINRMFRSVVYQRSTGALDSVPFGTRVDTYRTGYEWMGHSLAARKIEELDTDPRVLVGNAACTQPYSASILNISAMSFGALSQTAVLALNHGARIGKFAHNTGEGGLSPYHTQPGGDLIWQIGTGYFGCRTSQGRFCAQQFADKAIHPHVKMIEIKLSQGAKPGHGGLLPAAKNTPEIAGIRGVEPYIQIDSPPVHSAFSSPLEMMLFISQLRELSNGKPIGFKLCIGRKSEFVALCKAMLESGIQPDFITVDGGEGGTGAAPLEYSNSIGMPLREGLAFVVDTLTGFDLKKQIRVIAAGKIITGFHLLRILAMGADLGNSARGMMLALGCIQSLQCHNNQCPTGITTQNPGLYRGLVIADKQQRVANFHKETVEATVDLLSAAGLSTPQQLNREQIFRRVSADAIRSYAELFPPLPVGSLLKAPYPGHYDVLMRHIQTTQF
ncbi:MAG TPA: FMN-binding glutamate synthase family protein [Crenotrichaceae bacterium]|nr:FMN-binding glutamate synthase family protein [Crenotrichaceae bacterium]